MFGATFPIPQGSIMMPPIEYEQQKDMVDDAIDIDLNESIPWIFLHNSGLQDNYILTQNSEMILQ